MACDRLPREYRWNEIDPGVHPREGEHLLEAMLHWHDPAERLRTLRCRRNLISTITVVGLRVFEGLFATCGAHGTLFRSEA